MLDNEHKGNGEGGSGGDESQNDAQKWQEAEDIFELKAADALSTPRLINYVKAVDRDGMVAFTFGGSSGHYDKHGYLVTGAAALEAYAVPKANTVALVNHLLAAAGLPPYQQEAESVTEKDLDKTELTGSSKANGALNGSGSVS